MKDLNMRNKWLQIVIGILLVIAGIVVIVVQATGGNISKAVSIMVAILLFLIGALVLLFALLTVRSYFSPSYVYGALLIALGVVFLVSGSAIIEQGVPVFLGTLLIAVGVVGLVKGILLCVYKAPVLFIVLFFVFAAVAITFGILALVFRSEIVNIMYYCLGALIAVYGIVQIVYGAMAISKKKK